MQIVFLLLHKHTLINPGFAEAVVKLLTYYYLPASALVSLVITSADCSDEARILREMKELTCFATNYPISARFGYNFSRQTDFEAGIACFCPSLATSLVITTIFVFK